MKLELKKRKDGCYEPSDDFIKQIIHKLADEGYITAEDYEECEKRWKECHTGEK